MFDLNESLYQVDIAREADDRRRVDEIYGDVPNISDEMLHVEDDDSRYQEDVRKTMQEWEQAAARKSNEKREEFIEEFNTEFGYYFTSIFGQGDALRSSKQHLLNFLLKRFF